MKELFIYRLICDQYASRGGLAVPARDIINEAHSSRRTTYKALKNLLDMGFISKPVKGWYLPMNVYQWHMDDFDIKYKQVGESDG